MTEEEKRVFNLHITKMGQILKKTEMKYRYSKEIDLELADNYSWKTYKAYVKGKNVGIGIEEIMDSIASFKYRDAHGASLSNSKYWKSAMLEYQNIDLNAEQKKMANRNHCKHERIKLIGENNYICLSCGKALNNKNIETL